MERRLKTFAPSLKGPQLIDLFGYSTRGMASLEVHAHPKISRLLKEKLLFLTKSRKMKLPSRRYTLCIDSHQMHFQEGNLANFELPFLVLFWSLAEVLPIKNLQDCVCLGEVQINGEIVSQKLGQEHLTCLSQSNESLKVIGMEASCGIPTISLKDLMCGIDNIRIQQP